MGHLRYGAAEGGPFDGLKIAHHEDVRHVPIEIWSRKVRVGVQLGTPGYEFGKYTWENGKWVWTSAAAVSSQGSSRSLPHRR